MKLYRTTDPIPSSTMEGDWIYNGLDCLITREVFDNIHPQLDELSVPVYEFSKALQGPAVDMELRGLLVDQSIREEVRSSVQGKYDQIEHDLNKILVEGLGIEPINPRSPQQVFSLFHVILGLPATRRKGKPTVDEDALIKLKKYFYAEPIVNHLLALRDLKTQLKVLNTGIDSNGRIAGGYNIAGTDTFRFSSKTNSFREGTNMQNIPDELRRMFIADKGKKFAYIDGAQIQSRIVGAICWNAFFETHGRDFAGAYLDACESGDLHTLVCRLCWPDPSTTRGNKHFIVPRETLAWTGVLSHDKGLAKRIKIVGLPPGRNSIRDASKALGHGTNFFGKPPNMAKETMIPFDVVDHFRPEYLKSFPCIEERFNWTRKQLIAKRYLVTMCKQRRYFFGRPYEEETLKAALAYEPQAVESWIINHGMLDIWQTEPRMELMVQLHDAILIQYNEEEEDEILPRCVKKMEVEVPLLHGRSLIVPPEAAVGWNWSHANKNNPDGLVEYNGADKRKRTEARLMDTILY